MANLGVVDRNEPIQMFAKSVGQEKSEELIQETAAKFRLRNKESYTLVQATLILEEITKLPGTIGISTLFIKARLTDELRQIESFLTGVINSMPSFFDYFRFSAKNHSME